MESGPSGIPIPEKVDIWKDLPEELKKDIAAMAHIEGESVEKYLKESILQSMFADSDTGKMKELHNRIDRYLNEVWEDGE